MIFIFKEELFQLSLQYLYLTSNPTLDTPDTDRRTLDTPRSSKDDPSYYTLDTPRSRRELQTTRTETPITRPRARNMLQDMTAAQFAQI